MRAFLSSIGVIAGLCTGCTILTSETTEDLAKADRAPRGAYYALPKGVVDVSLSVVPSKAQFVLLIGAARYIPDPGHNYYLRYRPHPSYDDTVTVETNSSGLLNKIESTTVDQTPAIIVNLAKAITAFEAAAADAADPTDLLLNVTLDPLEAGEVRDTIKALNTKITDYIARASKACGYFDGAAGSASRKAQDALTKKQTEAQEALTQLQARKVIIDARVKSAIELAGKAHANLGKDFNCKTVPPTDPNVKAVCDLLKEQAEITQLAGDPTDDAASTTAAIKVITDQRKAQSASCKAFAELSANPPRAKIQVQDLANREPDHHHGWTPRVKVAASAPAPPETDCSIGVCYRPKEPYRLSYSLGSGDETAIVELPNRADLVAIDIRRAFFVQKIQNITFDNGFLLNLTIDKKSELVALSKIPVDVVTAISQGIQARIAITTQEKNLAQSQASLIKARAALNEARAKYESAPARPGSGLEAAPAGTARRTATGGATSRPILP